MMIVVLSNVMILLHGCLCTESYECVLCVINECYSLECLQFHFLGIRPADTHVTHDHLAQEIICCTFKQLHVCDLPPVYAFSVD